MMREKISNAKKKKWWSKNDDSFLKVLNIYSTRKDGLLKENYIIENTAHV